MTVRTTARPLVLALGLWLLAPAATAEELFASREMLDRGWGIGLGALIEDEGYVDGSSETEALPVLFYRGKRFQLLGPQAEWLLWERDGFSASARAEYRFDGYEEGDADIFEGMAEREAGFHLGAELKYRADWGHLTGEWLGVTGDAEGSRSALYYGYPMELGSWVVTPRVGLERYDRKFTDYYYGVRPDEAREGRAAYTADASTNVDVGVDFQRAWKHHLFLASAKYRRFGDGIADSPLVEDDGSLRFTVAWIYRF